MLCKPGSAACRAVPPPVSCARKRAATGPHSAASQPTCCQPAHTAQHKHCGTAIQHLRQPVTAAGASCASAPKPKASARADVGV